MTGEAEPLQGNLFGMEANNSAEPDQSEINGPNQKENLSDQELAEDAKQRPRTRTDLETINEESTKKQKLGDLASDDDPPWSNHTMVDPSHLTPMLRHYVELKKANPERLLLYRLGDFYECFFEDAIYLSRVLELTLTGKEGGKLIGRVPMAGIPHHAAAKYCTDLIRKGKSIALCDQLEAKPSKGLLLKRDITRVITPGTVIEEGMLAARKNNWLAALVIEEPERIEEKFIWGLASADVSTGEFILKQRSGISSLKQELSQIDASEIICGDLEAYERKSWCPERLHITKVRSTPFSQPEAETLLKKYYRLNTLDGLGIKEFPISLRAAGGLLSYLQDTTPLQDQDIKLNIEVPLMDIPRMNFTDEFLILDGQTRRNLEITTTQRDNLFQGSFLWAIDRTLTAMGGRCLRRWIEAPLVNIQSISNRQLLISKLVKERSIRKDLRRLLRPIGDLERIAGRAGAGHASGRDLGAIADGLERLPKLSKSISGLLDYKKNFLKKIREIDDDLIEITKTIRLKLIANPPLSLSEGGLIHDGVDPILDGLRNQLDDQEKWLSSQEVLERKISKNPNLRLQYHRTFGYFLAVSKARANNVPDHWIRRQTLANEERFITPDLKAREGKIFQLKARAAQREYELFCNLRAIVGKKTNMIRQAARDRASLDAMAGLAELAATEDYCKPEILTKENNKMNILIEAEESRHPVVEQLLVDESFIPNDIHLNKETEVIILTGPNASGKSCFLRQIGLIQLLAQIGSWVPAKKAKIAIVDRIFTRVGAVDDLAAGQSTFIVEMAETANILNNATNQSLVLLDEIGRGTSTFDGLAIAWSVSEYIAKNLHSKTVFATHYHELNSLSNYLDNVSNYQVMVKETGDELMFLHRVSEGGANQSYGIEAARLAGVPIDVLKRAREVLKKLEHDQEQQQLCAKNSEK